MAGIVVEELPEVEVLVAVERDLALVRGVFSELAVDSVVEGLHVGAVDF